MQWKWWHAQNEGEEMKKGEDFETEYKANLQRKAEANINMNKIAAF